MSGTTNNLVEIANYLYKKNHDGANEIVSQMEKKYYEEVEALYATDKYKELGRELIRLHFDEIKSYTRDVFTVYEEKSILAQGELMSTAMVNYYLQEQGVASAYCPPWILCAPIRIVNPIWLTFGRI